MLDNETKEFIIQKLNELYLKTYLKEKKNKKIRYVKLSQCYLDLIKFFNENL